MKRERLEQVLMQRGDARDKPDAFVIVTEGRVFVNGQKAVSPAQMVGSRDRVEVRAGREFVGRGAYKLEGALSYFGISVEGKTAADIGAATGGFTEVLLKRGAKKVYAIDTARGKLDTKLREDELVVVMEGANVLSTEKPEVMDIIVIDVSLTSIRIVLPVIRSWLAPQGIVVALFKPQYEANAKDLRHGIIEDEAVRENLVRDFRVWLEVHGFKEKGMMQSPIRGSEGNIEYLFLITLE